MGKLINANKEEFNKILETEEGVVLVDFWAEWCGPCRTLSPILESISEELDNAVIVKVNVDENSELSAQYAIRSIPTMIFFKDGESVDKLVGMNNKETIINKIEELSNSES